MAKRKKFLIQAKIDTYVHIEVMAADLADAVQQSKELDITDFLEVTDAEVVDQEIKVDGVFTA